MSWPVLVLVVVWSGILSLLGSGSTATGSLLARVAIALIAATCFVAMGFAEPSVDGYAGRMVPSLFTISFAFLVGAAGLATVLDYRATASLLLAEQRRLVTLLDALASGMEERQSDALERVQRRLDSELSALALETTPSAVASLQNLAGDPRHRARGRGCGSARLPKRGRRRQGSRAGHAGPRYGTPHALHLRLGAVE